MPNETNDLGTVVPEADSTKHDENPSPEQNGTEGGTWVETENRCVARNATHQIELVPDTEVGIPKEPDTTDIDEQELDLRISAKAEEIRQHQSEAVYHAEAEGACWRDLMPLLSEKQKWLTSRGKKSEKNFTAFLRSNNLNPSTVRSWRRRLKKEQAALLELDAVDSDEDSTDSNEEPDEDEGERVEIEPGPELLLNFVKRMLEVLTGNTIEDASTRIRHAVDMVKELRQATDEGKLFDSAASSSATTDVHAKVKRRLVPVVETAERYIRALEAMVHSQAVTLTEEQRKTLQKPMEDWRSILRYARGVQAERAGEALSTENAPASLKGAA